MFEEKMLTCSFAYLDQTVVSSFKRKTEKAHVAAFFSIEKGQTQEPFCAGQEQSWDHDRAQQIHQNAARVWQQENTHNREKGESDHVAEDENEETRRAEVE